MVQPHEHRLACDCADGELHWLHTPLQRVTDGLGWRSGVRDGSTRDELEAAFIHVEERLQELASMTQNRPTRVTQRWLGRWQQKIVAAIAGTPASPAPVSHS